MRTLLTLSTLLFLAACSSTKGTYQEQAGPKFSNTKEFSQKPEVVLRAAKIVLEELTYASKPPASKKVHEDGDTLRTGWVYGTSRDKYVSYLHNGAPQRKNLAVRRQYGYTVTPSLGGSQVVVSIEEEIEEVDLDSGEHEGWQNATPDPAAYDLLIRKLREKIRAL